MPQVFEIPPRTQRMMRVRIRGPMVSDKVSYLMMAPLLASQGPTHRSAESAQSMVALLRASDWYVAAAVNQNSKS